MKRIGVFILIGFLVWTCSSSPKDEVAVAESSVVMAEASELAKLMRAIHKDAKDWRSGLLEGEVPNEEINVYELLVRSKPTKSEVKGPEFERLASEYQQVLDSMLAAKDIVPAKVQYNNLVGACISCHQSFCPGPISTIKKLYISVD